MADVGGGVAAPRDDVWLGTDVLHSAAAEAAVRDDRAGAVSTFVGTTRGTFQGKVVVRLEYEAYEAMAVKQLSLLCAAVRAKHPAVLHVAVHHRLGVVDVGQASVVISVSSPHRREAIVSCRLLPLIGLLWGAASVFCRAVGAEACHFAIDELKATVPIWKREVYADGSTWKANCECTFNAKTSAPPAVQSGATG
eukprot:TRINITY_DN1655_c0_g1_i1.p2 TRINITY_DN1655_c0_g1~~TRINITY_DN1655_c0_g1_i1.p2  ORF type:complete len:195 (+),score=68.65 TRINITY_DN1655_c0_g1_i1:480-1064(+)